MLSATSLSHLEMVGLTTNTEVRHTEPEVGVSTLYARVHAVPVSSDVMLGRTGNATAVDGNLIMIAALSTTPFFLQTRTESAMGAKVVNATDQSLEPNLSALPTASQPSTEQVVYTEAKRAKKWAKGRERKQYKKAARKDLQLTAPEEILSHASLFGGVRSSRKRRCNAAQVATARSARETLCLEAALWPLQPARWSWRLACCAELQRISYDKAVSSSLQVFILKCMRCSHLAKLNA